MQEVDIVCCKISHWCIVWGQRGRGTMVTVTEKAARNVQGFEHRAIFTPWRPLVRQCSRDKGRPG